MRCSELSACACVDSQNLSIGTGGWLRGGAKGEGVGWEWSYTGFKRSSSGAKQCMEVARFCVLVQGAATVSNALYRCQAVNHQAESRNLHDSSRPGRRPHCRFAVSTPQGSACTNACMLCPSSYMWRVAERSLSLHSFTLVLLTPCTTLDVQNTQKHAPVQQQDVCKWLARARCCQVPRQQAAGGTVGPLSHRHGLPATMHGESERVEDCVGLGGGLCWSSWGALRLTVT